VWEPALAGVDTVCHQAGKVGLGIDFGDCVDYAAHNDLAWAMGLQAMHSVGFAGSIVLASSMVVYGEGRYRCAVDGPTQPAPRRSTDLERGAFEPPCPTCGAPLTAESVPEDAPADPRNVYAATKVHQEHLLAAFTREHRVASTSLRYHNVYGPRMPRDTPYAGVAAIFRSALERGDAPMVTEDGRQMRNFVHVRDVAAANLAAIDRPGDAGGHRAFNVASAEPRTVGAMAEAVATAFGASPGSATWPQVTGRYRLGDVRHVFASTDRAAAELGYASGVSFDEGMRDFARAPLREPSATTGVLP
jgi:dTDP-L-rhamnose 4-epimerase